PWTHCHVIVPFLNLLPLYPSGHRTTTEMRSSFIEHFRDGIAILCFRPLPLYGSRHKGCASLVREEHSMDFREVLPNIRFVRPHIRILLQKPAHRSLQQRVVIAAFDERVTDRACRPIAYALSNYARHCVRDEVLRRISPNHVVLRAKITHRSRHTFLHSLMFE